MEFMKYQRDEWELQKVRIKTIVGHCDAAEPEQYVNTLLTMLEERNSPKAESAEKSTNSESAPCNHRFKKTRSGTLVKCVDCKKQFDYNPAW